MATKKTDTPTSAAAGRSDAEPGGAELSYEDARGQLLDVVARLEQGGTTLEESLALWERGERLATLCQQWLDGARERLNAALAADDD